MVLAPVLLAAVLGIGAKCAAPAKTPENVIHSWPEAAQKIAEAMIERYGLPHRYDDDSVEWIEIPPWRKIVVDRDAVIEQTIRYEASLPEAAESLRDFDKRLEVDLAKGELSVRSESEPMNYLAFNLADEILKGNRSVESARAFYKKTARLAKAGKSSRYMNGFLFKGHPFMGKVYYP